MNDRQNQPACAQAYVVQIEADGTLPALRRFLHAWWTRIGLQAMLAPLAGPDGAIGGGVVDRVEDVNRIDPLAPLLAGNAAAAVADFVRDYPAGLLAVLLRPCELRTLVELQKRDRRLRLAAQDRLITIGIDCAGTLPPASYAAEAGRDGCADLTARTLMRIRAGTRLPAARLACRLCAAPAPLWGDMTIGLLGLPAHLLILASAGAAARLALSEMTPAGPDLVGQREHAVRAVTALPAGGNGQSAPAAVAADMLAWCACCTLCTDCLDACPLYRGELANMLGVGGAYERGRPILSELVGVSRWLASCPGCGMCQEACEREVPLTLLISGLSRRIQTELQYTPGDPRQPLPWLRSRPDPDKE